jgi:hypothetical protein
MPGFGRPVVVAALLSGVPVAVAQEAGSPHAIAIASQSAPGTISSQSAPGRQQENLLPVMFANGKFFAGNPLWAVPLGALSQTVERPLFSPSRRPPPPVLAAAPVPPAKPLPPPVAEPEHPLLTLLGTVVGGAEGIGIFLDETSHDVIRLKTGEVHGGWMLRSVHGRAADFERGDRRQATLAFPAPGVEPTTPSPGPDASVAARAAPGSNDRIAMPPPASARPPEASVLPAATKGKFKRTPREL